MCSEQKAFFVKLRATSWLPISLLDTFGKTNYLGSRVIMCLDNDIDLCEDTAHVNDFSQ